MKNVISRSAGRFMFALCILFLAAGCEKGPEADTADTVPLFQPFSFTVHLSPLAKDKLESIGESILGSLSFEGLPTADTQKNHPQEIGEGYVGLGSLDIQLNDGENATINDAAIDTEKLKFIGENKLELFVNVVSARKSATDNLLSCDDYFGPIDAIKNGKLEISCKLISEMFQ